jgi:hypothetical protein
MRRVEIGSALRIISAAAVPLMIAAQAFAAQGRGGQPGFFNGNFLYEACITDPRADPTGLSLCQGYAAAIADFADFMGIVCAPQGADVRQITDIIIRALKEKPEVRHMPALLLSLAALQKSYPCPHDHPVRQLGPN